MLGGGIINEDQIRAIVKQVIQEELKDITKTLNRIYEDREILNDLKTRVGTLEDVNKDQTDRIRKLEKNLSADVSDIQTKVEGKVEEIKVILQEGGE